MRTVGHFRGRPRKVSLAFPESMNAEIEAEAAREGRSVSELMRLVWLRARRRLRAAPGHGRLPT